MHVHKNRAKDGHNSNMDFAQILSTCSLAIMYLNAMYNFLSHVYFYFGENAKLRVLVEIAIFSAEITAYFAGSRDISEI